jgi:very-short-patch-repair endonuclease
MPQGPPLPLAGGEGGGLKTVVQYKNPPNYIQRAKELRKQLPIAERRLWGALCSLKQQTGLKFRRQHPVHPYIADFACVAARLIIELDGMSHDTRQTYDARRDAYLQEKSWMVIRFSNDDVQNNLKGVVLTIMGKIDELLSARKYG